jgi:hypothetical protein
VLCVWSTSVLPEASVDFCRSAFLMQTRCVCVCIHMLVEFLGVDCSLDPVLEERRIFGWFS